MTDPVPAPVDLRLAALRRELAGLRARVEQMTLIAPPVPFRGPDLRLVRDRP